MFSTWKTQYVLNGLTEQKTLVFSFSTGNLIRTHGETFPQNFVKTYNYHRTEYSLFAPSKAEMIFIDQSLI